MVSNSNPCWLDGDSPWSKSIAYHGEICVKYGTTDLITACVVFGFLGLTLISIGLVWLIRYSRRVDRFQAFWNQSASLPIGPTDDLGVYEMKINPSDISLFDQPPMSSQNSPTGGSASSRGGLRPKYSVPQSTSRPASLYSMSRRNSVHISPNVSMTTLHPTPSGGDGEGGTTNQGRPANPPLSQRYKTPKSPLSQPNRGPKSGELYDDSIPPVPPLPREDSMMLPPPLAMPVVHEGYSSGGLASPTGDGHYFVNGHSPYSHQGPYAAPRMPQSYPQIPTVQPRMISGPNGYGPVYGSGSGPDLGQPRSPLDQIQYGVANRGSPRSVMSQDKPWGS